MAVKIAEKFAGIQGSQDDRQILYVIENAKSDQDALNIAEAAAPLTYDLMPRQNVRVVEKAKYANADRVYSGGDEIEEQDPTVADGTYYITALYSRRRGTQPVEQTDEKPAPADDDGNHNTFSFEQSLETVRIREGFGVNRYTAGGSGTPNPNDAIKFSGINVQPDGTVEGVDIRSPIGSFALDFYPDKDNVSIQYQTTVMGLVGSVNLSTFFGNDPGTVLFTGATGRKRNQQDWEFNFRFETRPNVTNVFVGEGSDKILYSKTGHQYAWVYYDEVKETTVGGEERSILRPRQVNVETVYESKDLNLLFAI